MGDEQHVVVNLCWLGLEDTKQVGWVDKDDNYKDDNLGDKDIHLGMDGKPFTKMVSSLYFFFGEECNFDFFMEKIPINLLFFKCCLPGKRKQSYA
jgi:hypothetical protein